jgi:hypothetical protein
MLLLFTLILVAGVALAQYRNGLFTSVTMLMQVIIAGLVAFGLFEPVADELDGYWQAGAMAGYEDCIALAVLFAVTLAVLRLITNRYLNKEISRGSSSASSRRCRSTRTSWASSRAATRSWPLAASFPPTASGWA